MSQSNIPPDSDIKAIREKTKLGRDENHESIILELKDRRKLVADYYYDKANSAEDRQKFFDELSLLHEYFGFKKVWPAIKSNGNALAKQVRSTEEKQTDIKAMHDFCWKKAVEEAKKVYKEFNKDQLILSEHFNKQFTNNWIS